jgi:TIR domain
MRSECPKVGQSYALSSKRALVGSLEPIQFYSCFISYSFRDQAFADRLHADLRAAGVRCWYAQEDMKIGDEIRVRIDETIRIHDKLLLVLSKSSVSSDWVEKEVETALEKERRQKRPVLFPIRLDDAVMKSESGWSADIRRSRHIGDFRKWKAPDAYKKVFDRLLRDLRAEEATGGEGL